MSGQPTNDGGPAYPESGSRGIAASGEGMSLRDHFAERFAPVIWKQFNEDGTKKQFDNWRDGVAIEAYRMADAMLDAKEGGAE